MCISFNASILAFLVGEISGFMLTQHKLPHKRPIGWFIMFFSLIQLLDALVYKGIDPHGLVSKLLLLNLGLQGTVFFMLMKEYNSYLYISILCSLMILYNITNPHFKKNKVLTCVNWFYDDVARYTLCIIYPLVLFYLIQTPVYRNLGLISAAIMLILFLLKPKETFPSIWCLVSTFVAPFYFLF